MVDTVKVPVACLLHKQLHFTAPIVVDPVDQETQMCGLKKRVLRPLHVAKTALLAELKAFVEEKVKELPPILVDVSKDPERFREWVSRGSWTAAQQEKLRRHWEENLSFAMPSVKKCSRVKPFIKREAYHEIKHARWIMAGNDTWKIYGGMWFHEMEKIVYGTDGYEGLTNNAGHHWFIKHTPISERPALVRELRMFGKKYMATDFTSFEASFLPEVTDALECVLYRHLLKNFPDVADLICGVIQSDRHGKTRQGVSFKRPGGRMSGDPCTSLGNGFSNLMLWLFWASKTCTHVTGYVEGDDAIMATNSDDNPQEMMRDLGFDIKVQLWDDPCKASFCGIICSESLDIIRDPFDAIHKFGWSLTNPNASDRSKRRLLKAKAMSLRCEAPNCPILRSLADWAIRECGAVRPRFEKSYYKMDFDLKIKAPDIKENTRTLFYELFGIDPDYQKVIEDQISKGVFCLLEDMMMLQSPSIIHDMHTFCRFNLRSPKTTNAS